jgi:hypothetical protein
MARAFGDFCLKDYGLISVPEISYRRLSEKDEFIILATDGVYLINYHSYLKWCFDLEIQLPMHYIMIFSIPAWNSYVFRTFTQKGLTTFNSINFLVLEKFNACRFGTSSQTRRLLIS